MTTSAALGCRFMAIGSDTLDEYSQGLPAGMSVALHPEAHNFHSIHGTSTTRNAANIPTSRGDRGSILKPAVFEEGSNQKAPFLLSLPLMLYLRATLELDPQEGRSLTSRSFNFKVPLHLGPTGALRVPLQQFNQHIERHVTSQIGKNSAVKEYEILISITGPGKLAVDGCTDPTFTSIPANPSGISLSHAETATGLD